MHTNTRTPQATFEVLRIPRPSHVCMVCDDTAVIADSRPSLRLHTMHMVLASTLAVSGQGWVVASWQGVVWRLSEAYVMK